MFGDMVDTFLGTLNLLKRRCPVPWKQTTRMDQRLEFAMLADQQHANHAALCRRFGISRQTGYKWLQRYRNSGRGGLIEHSRKPHTSPHQTPGEVERAACALRREHPAWGGRKLRARLLRMAQARQVPFQAGDVPAASTLTAILRRNGLLRQEDTEKAQPWCRFEKQRPNELWQMDFKGDFALGDDSRCYPLTVVDDHSRFSVVLAACANQQRQTVQGHLVEAFRRYGLPERVITDHGSPWGVGKARPDGASHYTRLSAWLMRLCIGVSFARRGHPQTNGKNERFNRTLTAEVLRFEHFHDLDACRGRFAAWRRVYNLERPHEALAMAVPASRYVCSARSYPEVLPPVEYGPGEEVRQVGQGGRISFRGRMYRVGKAFAGEPVALRPSPTDGVWRVYFCRQHVRTIDLHRAHV